MALLAHHFHAILCLYEEWQMEEKSNLSVE
jgi:hypothetical protein